MPKKNVRYPLPTASGGPVKTDKPVTRAPATNGFANDRERVLLAWIGNADLRASRGELNGQLGPTAQALQDMSITHAYLLSNYDQAAIDQYLVWVRQQTKAKVTARPVMLSRPTMLGEIYVASKQMIETALHDFPRRVRLFYHLSPGTPQMAIVWMMLANSDFPGELLESSVQGGVNILPCPFEVTVRYLPGLPNVLREEVANLAEGQPPIGPEFDEIVHQSKSIRDLIVKARRLAIVDFPVIIEGESGTGKELFARAIHKAGPRRDGAFISVNCGAIPRELFEAEFFGHERGAFTGALLARNGYIGDAHHGTLFLDEVGELPLDAQVKLLRVLQEKKVCRLGSTTPHEVDVRVIAATNRSLNEELAAGTFRHDLFHRLAVGILRLPSLRERREDLGQLIDHCLARVNRECHQVPGWQTKRLDAVARHLLFQHHWPGNIRELLNTVTRACLWTPGATVGAAAMREALLDGHRSSDQQGQELLQKPLGDGFSLSALLDEITRVYLRRGWEEARGNKTQAARLLGLPNYQTFSNWYEKYCGSADESSLPFPSS